MQSIKDIRDSVDKRTTKQSPIVASDVKTISSLREKQTKDDSVAIERKRLVEQNRNIQLIIKRRTKDLNQLNDILLKKSESAIGVGQNIIEATKKRANNIIEDANIKKIVAEDLLKHAEKVSESLKEKEKSLVELAATIDSKGLSVRESEKVLGKRGKTIEEAETLVKTRLEEASELLNTMNNLVILAIREVTNLVSIDKEVINTIYQNVEKADKMYVEILKIESQVSADKKVNKQRAEELGNKEKWINDKYVELARATREIKVKRKK